MGVHRCGLVILFITAFAGSVRADTKPVCRSLDQCLKILFKPPYTPIPDDAIRAAETIQTKYAKAALPRLLRALRDPKRGKSYRASLTLRDMPGLGPQHLDAFFKARNNGDQLILIAIARVGTERAIRFLASGIPQAYSHHTRHIEAFEILGKRGVPHLVELARCKKVCTKVSYRILATIFEKLGADAAKAVKPLTAIVMDARKSVLARRGAIQCLGSLGPLASAVAPKLARIAETQPTAFRKSVTSALVRMRHAAAVPLLTRDFEAGHLDAPCHIAALGPNGRAGGKALERFLSGRLYPGPPPKGLSIAQMKRYMKSGSLPTRLPWATSGHFRLEWHLSELWLARVFAANALGLIGYQPAVPILISATKYQPDWRLNYMAVRSLARFKGSPGVLQALRETSQTHWYRPVKELAGRATQPSFQPKSLNCLEMLEQHYGVEPTGDNCGSLGGRVRMQLAVAGGTLKGINHGEFGGGLVFIDSNGRRTAILAINVVALFKRGKSVVVVTGVSHLTTDRGDVFELRRGKAGWMRTRCVVLPSAPYEAKETPSGEIVIRTRRGTVALTKAFTLRQVQCTK